ncbi:MAG: hypothetical protein QXN67_03875, partial [Thermoproteota archaeon]
SLPAWFHVYSRAIGGKKRLVYNVTETRWYRVRRRIEGLYNITYLDLETGETHNVLTSLSLGVYPEFGIAGGPAQPSFPSFLLKYFPGYANLTTIPPGTTIDFSRSTPSFLVAVPGHYEDVDVLVPEHEEKFRVLFPAYDPVWLTGWIIETSLSSSNVEAGDILEVSYVATPESIDPEEQPLNATITLLCPEGFEPLDDTQRVLNNTQTSGCFKLKAIAPGTYVLTLKLNGNAFFPGWPPTDEVSYVVNVVGPESPRVEVSLEGGEPLFKHVNLTIRLENKGAGEALNTILEFSGDVEPLSLSVGNLSTGETWSRVVTLRLRSAMASIRARATFFDSSGNKYVSEGFATVVSPAYVVPEHFEEYTLRVPEHFEKRRVFVPGYEGYTHVKIYHPFSAFEIPGSFTISFQGLILEAEGVKVYTSFLPIADEGFELRVVPKNLTLNIYGNVLVGPLIPVQGLQTTVPVKYVVKSVTPAFEEKLVREDEAKMMLNVTGCGEIVAPEGYEVILASKRVIRKQVWVDSETYRRLQQEGFGRIREGCYWYEDGNKEEWPSSDAILELTPLERELYANRIVLVYHPLQETPLESSLIRGIWLRNYATQDIDYTVTVEPVTLPPGKPENTALKAEKACCKELSILLFANTTFWIRLSKGDRLVAELFLPKLLILPFPFSLQWWRGFIIGLVERSPRIMMNTMMLSTVAMVPRELMPAIAAALVFLKAYQVYNQRGEIFNATTALGNLTAMGLIYRGMADGYRLQGKRGFAAICDNLSQTFFSRAKEVAADLGLRLVMDVTLEDVKTALGLRKASEYEQGYAAGKIVGAMVEAVTYAATFATIYYELSTARDMLTMAGEAGQISSPSVLKRFAQGLYAWVTPAIWDLAETGIRFGAWLKGKLDLRDVSKLIFADRVSREFGETVGRALETLPDGGEPEEIAKRASNIVDRVTSDNDIPESVGARILSILGEMGEEYVDREDAAETIVEAWKRVSELEAWRKGDEAGKLLMDWLGSLEKERLGEAFDALQKFAGLGEEELNSLGKALGKIGFENGVKLFDTYFKISNEPLRNHFLDTIKKAEGDALEVLNAWLGVIPRNGFVLVAKEYESGKRFIYLPASIAKAYGLEDGSVVSVIFGEIEVTGAVYEYSEGGGLAVTLGASAYDIFNIKGGTPLSIVASEVSALVTRSNVLHISELKRSPVDEAITRLLKKSHAYEIEDGYAVLIDVQKIDPNNLDEKPTSIGKDIRLWRPSGEIKLPVGDESGLYYLKIEPLTIDKMMDALSNTKDSFGNPVIVCEGNKFKFFGKNLDFEYVKGVLKSILDISETDRKIAVNIYYDKEENDIDAKFTVFDGHSWHNVKNFWINDEHKVIVFKYEENKHLILSYEDNVLKPHRIGPPSAWGDLYYRIAGEPLSFCKGKLPSVSLEGDGGKIETNVPGFEEYYEDLMSNLNEIAQGVFGTEIFQAALEKTGKKVIVDITGVNAKHYYFDIEDDPNKITFAGEVKSRWSEKVDASDLERAFEAAIVELNAHAKKHASLLATDYGYAVVINIMPNKIVIYWRKVSLTTEG